MVPVTQLQVSRRTGKVHRLKTDVLPLCHATKRQRRCCAAGKVTVGWRRTGHASQCLWYIHLRAQWPQTGRRAPILCSWGARIWYSTRARTNLNAALSWMNMASVYSLHVQTRGRRSSDLQSIICKRHTCDELTVSRDTGDRSSHQKASILFTATRVNSWLSSSVEMSMQSQSH